MRSVANADGSSAGLMAFVKGADAEDGLVRGPLWSDEIRFVRLSLLRRAI